MTLNRKPHRRAGTATPTPIAPTDCRTRLLSARPVRSLRETIPEEHSGKPHAYFAQSICLTHSQDLLILSKQLTHEALFGGEGLVVWEALGCEAGRDQGMLGRLVDGRPPGDPQILGLVIDFFTP